MATRLLHDAAIVHDFRRYFLNQKGNGIKRVLGVFLTEGFRAVAVYRLGHWLLGQWLIVRVLLKPLFKMLYWWVRVFYGIELRPDGNIGKGFLIHHYGGIFVLGNIGEGVTISQDVTIGVAGRGQGRGIPEIGNNVYVSPGAKIAGDIKIGDGARIGANAVVERDVPPGGLVQLRLLPIVVMGDLYHEP
jgi:serine O-acetyltransferase